MVLSTFSLRSVGAAKRIPFLAFTSSTPNKRSNYIFPSDDDTSVPIPTRTHGYRISPFSWSELRQIIVEDNDLEKLSRSVQQEETYQKYRRDLLDEYKSVYDHVMHSKFGFTKIYNNTIQRWEAQVQESGSKTVRKALLPNDFPYYTQNGIEHWVLWKLNGYITENDVEEAKIELLQKLGDVLDLVHWENPPHLKSLPDIEHIHILVRRKSNDNEEIRN